MDCNRYVLARERLEMLIVEMNLLDWKSVKDKTRTPRRLGGGEAGDPFTPLPPRPSVISEKKKSSSASSKSAGLRKVGELDNDKKQQQQKQPHQRGEEESLLAQVRRMLRDDDQITSVEEARPQNMTKQLRQEMKIFGRTNFYPTDKTSYPRNPADEGLYVLNNADVLEWNAYKIEARLLREDPERKFFFDENGQVLVPKQMWLDGAVRAFTVEEYMEAELVTDPRLSVHSMPPTSDNGVDKWYNFAVCLSSVTFTDHFLYSAEDYLCMQLKDEVNRWTRRQTVDLIKYYSERIRAIKDATNRNILALERLLHPGTVGAHNRISAIQMTRETLVLLNELRECRTHRDEEWGGQSRHFAHIYNLWTNVREFRKHMTDQLENKGFSMFKRDASMVNMGGRENVPPGNNNSNNNGGGGANDLNAEALEHARATYLGVPLSLKVRKTLNNKNEDIQRWREDEKAEFEEMQKTWEISNLLGSLEKQQEQEQEQNNSSSNSSNPPASTDPFQPEPFNHEDALISIRSRMRANRRLPGKAVYEPVLDFSHTEITPNSSCLPEEVERREQIGKAWHYVILYVNGQEVARSTRTKVLFPHFKLDCQLNVDLKVIAVPYSISCDIMREGFFGSDKLAEVVIPVPEYGHMGAVQKVEFSGNSFGSDAVLEKYGASTFRFLGGHLECSVFWEASNTTTGKDDDQPGTLHFNRQAEQQGKIFALSEQRGVNSKMAEVLAENLNSAHRGLRTSAGRGADRAAVDRSRRSKILALEDMRTRLDPHDPRNAVLLELLRRNAEETDRDFYAWNFNDDLFLLNDKYYVESSRKKVLQYRNYSMFFREAVPIDEKDISPQLFELTQAHLDAPSTSTLVIAEQGRIKAGEKDHHGRGGTLPPDLHLLYGPGAKKMDAMNASSLVHDVSDVVKEEELPTFKLDLTFLDTLFAPHRPLRVVRDVQKPIAKANTCSIIVQVIKASNVPVRWTKPTAGANDGLRASGAQVALQKNAAAMDALNCNVDVSFQDVNRQTFTTGGSHPRWNQVLQIPFNVAGDSYEPTVLRQILDAIEFRLYDNITTYAESPDYRLQNTRMERRESRYLGSVKVPFATLFKQGTIEGALEIDTPVMPLGYQKPKQDERSLLYCYMTLQPVITPPKSEVPHASEFNPAYKTCLSWNKRVMARKEWKKERTILTVVGDIYGNPQLVCRYIKPQPPPPECRYNPVVFTRFVAQIPFVEDFQMPLQQDDSSDFNDVWCTSKQFINLHGGDWEEHANLLCNFFLWWDSMQQRDSSGGGLDWQTFVVLGTAVPDGDVAYVLRIGKKNNITEEELFYNPVTGKVYNLDYDGDVLPLRHIGVMFNDENVWANIQANDRPIDLGLDVRNPINWLPLFDSSFTRKVYSDLLGKKWTSIQKPLTDCYDHGGAKATIRKEWEGRASRLERIVEKHFERWRVLPTHWNYGVSRILSDVLEQLEIIEQKESDALGNKGAIAKVRANYPDVYGFPLHFSVSSDNDDFFRDSVDNPIITAIKKCRVHENENPDGAFAIAAYIYPYTSTIGSLWVYIASLSSRASD